MARPLQAGGPRRSRRTLARAAAFSRYRTVSHLFRSTPTSKQPGVWRSRGHPVDKAGRLAALLCHGDGFR